jgi:hypothetical protein
MRTPSRRGRLLSCLALLLVVRLCLPGPSALAAPAPPAPPAPVVREDLEYQVSLGPCGDVGRVHLVLTEMQPGGFRAEVSGTAKGLGQLSKRWLPERYRTEMVYRDGRLVPLVYREEFFRKGRRILKEYRFDYNRGQVSLWRRAEGGEFVKKWQVPLKSPVYDYLSLFYNVRLGVFGPLPGGSTLKVKVLPTPEPQEMVFAIGLLTNMVRKVMLDRRRSESKAVKQYFFYLSPDQVPTLAWTHVPLLGKLTARLVNPGEIKKEGLLLPPLSGAPAPKTLQ